jgi:Zn-dependent protease
MLRSLSDPVQLITIAILFIVSITLHEFGHAIVAHALGDPTPQRAGRVTLNPLAHLDVFGTIMMFVAGFGWAKPVPVGVHNFKHPRLGDIAVSLAGPGTNLVLALMALAAFKYVPNLSEGAAMWLQTAFAINTMLLAFNMLPIPPLDGGHVVKALLPRRFLPGFEQLAPYGTIALLALVLLPLPWSPLSWLFTTVRGVVVHMI